MESKILTGEQKKESKLEGLKISGLYTQAPHDYREVFARMSGIRTPDFSKTVLGAVLEQERQGNLEQAMKHFPGGRIDLIGGIYTSLVDMASRKQFVVKMNF